MKFDTSKYSRDLSKYYKLPLVKVSLTLVLSIFVITLFLGLALRPTLISITSLIKTIEESKKTYQSLQEKIDNLFQIHLLNTVVNSIQIDLKLVKFQ